MRLFLTGATGLVGSNLAHRALETRGAAVFAALHRRELPERPGLEQAPVDLTDRAAVDAAVRAFRPDAVVHCAYEPDLARLHRDRAYARRVMLDATRGLTEAATEAGAKVVLVSTDWVFDGESAPADEATLPAPVNLYGVLKVVGETIVTTLDARHAVARVAGVFGVHRARPDWRGRQNAGFGALVDAAVDGLRGEGAFGVWSAPWLNQRANATLASDAAELILRAVERDARGVLHCVGGEGAGRLELARRAARAFGLPEDAVREVPPPGDEPTRAAGMRVPADTRLVGPATERALGRPLLPLDEALARYRAEREAAAA